MTRKAVVIYSFESRIKFWESVGFRVVMSASFQSGHWILFEVITLPQPAPERDSNAVFLETTVNSS